MKTGKEEKKPISQGYFTYPDYAVAELARIEQEKIVRLESQMNYDKPKVVFALYKKALDNHVFQTPEGFAFLYKLRSYLQEHQSEIGEEIPGIPAGLLMSENRQALQETQAELSGARQAQAKYRTRSQLQWIVIAFLAVALVAMLIVAGLSESPNILNYEKALQNRYADWHTELSERESAVRERERELGITHTDRDTEKEEEEEAGNPFGNLFQNDL